MASPRQPTRASRRGLKGQALPHEHSGALHSRPDRIARIAHAYVRLFPHAALGRCPTPVGRRAATSIYAPRGQRAMRPVQRSPALPGLFLDRPPYWKRRTRLAASGSTGDWKRGWRHFGSRRQSRPVHPSRRRGSYWSAPALTKKGRRPGRSGRRQRGNPTFSCSLPPASRGVPCWPGRQASPGSGRPRDHRSMFLSWSLAGLASTGLIRISAVSRPGRPLTGAWEMGFGMVRLPSAMAPATPQGSPCGCAGHPALCRGDPAELAARPRLTGAFGSWRARPRTASRCGSLWRRSGSRAFLSSSKCPGHTPRSLGLS